MLREKEILELPLAELVVGDIAKFKYGNALPVDGILVQVKREGGRVCECGCEGRWVMTNILVA